MSDRYVVVRDLAQELGVDASNLAVLLRKRGHSLVRVRNGGYTNQLANAVTVDDAKAFVEWMRSRAVESGKVVRGDDLRGMIEQWRKT